MAGDDLTVKVDANVSGYEAGVERAQRATMRYQASLASLESDLMKLEKSLDDDVAAALQRQNDAMESTGRGLFVFGAAAAVGLGLAVNEAMKWESAWAGVTKTVDGSAPQMEKLEADLRNLATTLPATHEEIAAVAEAAGQLGVAREDIISFTKVMVDLGETTNLTADDAATAIAQMMNVMQTAPEDVGRMGAALVALGNDGASTEAQILGMAQRIAGAGASIGLAESEVLAIANALASVGIEVEAGGSAISAVMKEIQLDVSTNAARLEDWARVAGMSAEEFKSLWQQDAAAGLDAFVRGLGNIQANGGDAVKVLADLEITQIRQSDALLRLAGAGDLLTESLVLGNQAWEENSALLEEAAKRYGTTESRVQVARNQLRDAAIDMGSVLLPALAEVAGTMSNFIRAWQDVPKPIRTAIVVLGVLVTSLSLFGGAVMMAQAKIAGFAATTAALPAGPLKNLRGGLASTAGFLMGPWGAAIALGVAAVALLAAEHGKAAREVEAYRATLDEAGNATEQTFQQALENLSAEGWLDYAKDVGISMEEVVAAVTQGGGALDELKAKVAEAEGNMGTGESFWNNLTGDSGQFIENIENARGKIAEAQEQGRLLSEGNAQLAGTSAAAGDAQEGATAAWSDGADAAGDLNEEIKTLGENLSDLADAYLNNRDAGRQVRDGLRQIRNAVKEYRNEHGSLKGAFKEGTESGDKFSGMLDDLAQDYLTQIETTERVSGSQRKTMQVYRESRASLIDVAQSLGMTERQAKQYANQILGTPKLARTLFDAQTGQASADIAALQRQIDEAARNRQARIDITVQMHRRGAQTVGGLQEADGGIVQAYGDGGFSSGGSRVDRMPQLRVGGGTVTWNEPETGWEAYISGKPSMLARNRGVWAEAGRRLGIGSGGGSTVVVQQVSLDGVRVEGRIGADGYLRGVIRQEASQVARAEVDGAARHRRLAEGGR